MRDQELFAMIFTGEGAVELEWEQATRCDCFSDDTLQPEWGHEPCQGTGVIYAAPLAIRGLFRSQSRWTTRHSSGERDLADAQLTVPLELKPGYTDERVRDRFTVIRATDPEGAVFYPSAEATPFVLAGAQRAWRVKVIGAKRAAHTRDAP